ncbi:hypothetical protein DER29_6294 [Micromonospora sp. M71_S20]|uniref:hypothetical protein n=1 Tax=Micromonospora sp. M71_S20 TaxID=592872 RepID=UPI000F184CB2|nr:hypothetical protein [Micromonospora sp. M71_S20]RLK09732.1 hypothetical protein DER29_6294 [Micromonospora sp. M71_S20]
MADERMTQDDVVTELRPATTVATGGGVLVQPNRSVRDAATRGGTTVDGPPRGGAVDR